MPIAKPPISPDVAELIGTYAEKVENRSLLLGKFVVHKSWPEDNVLRRKLDDAVRWSFIRCTENGEKILNAELDKLNGTARRRAGEEQGAEAAQKARILSQMIHCKCRGLSKGNEEMRKAHVDRLIDLVKESSLGHRILFGRLESRLAVNLSGSLIQNAGICLDRFFGMPYLPGSAVKGVCRHVALEELRAGKLSLGDFQDIFGTADVDFKGSTSKGRGGELEEFANRIGEDGVEESKKGCIDFLAAYPRSEAKLMVDLTNVHYPEYYRTGREEELANENPRPNPFPVVEAGAEFAFCIVVNSMGGRIEKDARREELLDKAAAILRRAMVEWGFGAKTGAGYGWFADETDAISSRREDEVRLRDERQRKKDEEEARHARTLAIFDEVKSQLAELEARDLVPADRSALAQLDRKLLEADGEGTTPLRDRLNVLRKKLPAESFADKLAAMHPNEVVAKFIAGFANLKDDDEKMAVVEFLRTESGRKIWIAVHTDKKVSKKCGGGTDVHKFLKDKGLPKIPQ